MAARSLSLDISDHRAVALRLGELRRSDLVIGFEQRHVASAVVEGEARRERTFLLSELVALLAELPDDRTQTGDGARERMGKLLDAADRARSSRLDKRLEIPDPIGRGPDKHAEIARRIADEVARLERYLFPPPPPPPPPPRR